MSEIKDGGPAFPGLHPSAECRYADQGMTLRDYFAAKAVSALVTRDRNRQLISRAEDTARQAYEIADAMLEARK